jgi:hypothetical protein
MTTAEIKTDLKRRFDLFDQEYLSRECAGFQQLLENDLRRLELIRELDQNWQSHLSSGAIRFDFEFDRMITKWYGAWLKFASQRLDQLQGQEARGRCPPAADLFRAQVEEVKEELAQRARSEMAAQARFDMLREND